MVQGKFMIYIPSPAVICEAEEGRSYGSPYFYEYNGQILNLAAANGFYVDHVPLTSYYWPSVRIGSSSYHLSPSVSTEERAMEFLRNLTKKMQAANSAH